MSLRERIIEIIDETVNTSGQDVAYYRNTQRQNDRQFLGRVQSITEGKATVVFPDGSTTEAIVGTRDVVKGDACVVIAGKIL